MEIYIIFLAFIFICSFACNTFISNYEKSRKYFINIIFVCIYLIYALRAPTVGRDVMPYYEAFLMTRSAAFSDFNYIYFENGYLLLMKIATHVLHLSFQQYIVIVYALMVIPIYLAIKKFSKNYLLSTLVFVCYMFFEFDMTAIRQALATSVLLLGIIILLEAKRFPALKYILICVVACTLHKSAFVAFFYLPFHYMRNVNTYASSISAFGVIILATRKFLMTYIKALFEKDTMNANADLYIGLNFVFLVAWAVIFVYTEIRKNSIEDYSLQTEHEDIFGYKLNTLSIKFFLLSIVALLLFGTDNTVRSSMLLSQVIIWQIPNCTEDLLDSKLKKIVNIALMMFFVAFMFANTLLANNFDIVPYKFYWQI